MVFFMSGSNKRGVTSCIPASYFTRVYPYARGMEEAVKGVEEETETAMETSWANVALNIFHCVMAALNLWAYRRRPQGHVVAQDNGRQLARRAREEEEEWKRGNPIGKYRVTYIYLILELFLFANFIASTNWLIDVLLFVKLDTSSGADS